MAYPNLAGLESLASLPQNDSDTTEEAGRTRAALLADVARARKLATAEERNRLARQLFAGVIVVNRTAVAV